MVKNICSFYPVLSIPVIMYHRLHAHKYNVDDSPQHYVI